MKKTFLTPLVSDSIIDNTGTIWQSIRDDIRDECGYDIISFQEIAYTSDDISDTVSVIERHIYEEENPHVLGGLTQALLDPRYLHLININKLIEKYKSFDDTWIKNNPNGGKGTLAHLISIMIDRDDLDKIYNVFLNDETLGDTRTWFLDRLNKYKANQKFYDYLISHKDIYKERESVYGIYGGDIPYEEGLYMDGKINYLLGTKKWKKFAEENK